MHIWIILAACCVYLLDALFTLPFDGLGTVIMLALGAYGVYHFSISRFLIGKTDRYVDLVALLGFGLLLVKNVIVYESATSQGDVGQFVMMIIRYADALMLGSVVAGSLALVLAGLLFLRHPVSRPSLLALCPASLTRHAVVHLLLSYLGLLAFFVFVVDLLAQWVTLMHYDIWIGIGTFILLLLFSAPVKAVGLLERQLLHRGTLSMGVAGLFCVHIAMQMVMSIVPLFSGSHLHIPGTTSLFSLMLYEIGMIASWPGKLAAVYLYGANVVVLLIMAALPLLVWYRMGVHREYVFSYWSVGVTAASMIGFLFFPLWSMRALEEHVVVGVGMVAHMLFPGWLSIPDTVLALQIIAVVSLFSGALITFWDRKDMEFIIVSLGLLLVGIFGLLHLVSLSGWYNEVVYHLWQAGPFLVLLQVTILFSLSVALYVAGAYALLLNLYRRRCIDVK